MSAHQRGRRIMVLRDWVKENWANAPLFPLEMQNVRRRVALKARGWWGVSWSVALDYADCAIYSAFHNVGEK